MGKCFEKELQNLDLIYDNALTCEVHIISDFLRKYKDECFLLVGSGGSYSVAATVEYFFIKAGWKAKKITPLELMQYKTQIKDSVVIIFTASGRNVDSKNAYNYVSEFEAKGILTVCMTLDSPISTMQRFNLHNNYFEYKMPVKKDGYLAVESLVSSIVIMAKAFKEATQNPFYVLAKRRPSSSINTVDLNKVLSKETIIVLNAGITSPTVVDLESKFGEVSLGNIQLLDYRNFAHGRHFWLSDRRESTGIILFVDKENRGLADKTLKLIPDYISKLRIDIQSETVEGIFEAYDSIFEIVNHAGKLREINPGKPFVEEFGRKLYHMSYKYDNYAWIKEIKKNPVYRAVYRKQGIITNRDSELYQNANCCYSRLINSEYKGIVFDYDGTLHIKNNCNTIENEIFKKINELLNKGIRIGVATGRGKSVRRELQDVIQRQYWDEVVICYYNGGCVGLLSDDRQPDKNSSMMPREFEMIKDILSKEEGFTIDGLADKNPYQLSIIDDEIQIHLDDMREKLSNIENIKVLVSSHSIDIIPWKSSKKRIFEYYEAIGYNENDFLKVGDSGQYGGNDFELLNCQNGISVDMVSNSTKYCWNFQSLGKRNLEGTLELLDWIKVSQDEKSFIIEVI